MKDTHAQFNGSAKPGTSQAGATAQHSTVQANSTVQASAAPDPTGRGAPPTGTAPPTPEAQADAEAQAVPQGDAAAAGTDERTDERGDGAQLLRVRAVRFGSHGGYGQVRADGFRRAASISHRAAAVYTALSLYVGTQAPGYCFRTWGDLAQDIGRTHGRSARRGARELQDAGLILILHRPGRPFGFFFPGDGEAHETPDRVRLPAAVLRAAWGAKAREAVQFDPKRCAFVPFGAPLDTEAEADGKPEARPPDNSVNGSGQDPRTTLSDGAEKDGKDPRTTLSTPTPGQPCQPLPPDNSVRPNRQKEQKKETDNNNNNTRTHEAETSGDGRTDAAPVVVVGDSVEDWKGTGSSPNSTADAAAQAETAGTDGTDGAPALEESILRADGVRMARGTAREILRERGEAWAQAAFQHARKNADRSVAGYICALHRRDWTPKRKHGSGGAPQGRGGCWGDYAKPTNGTGPDGRGGCWGPEYLEGNGAHARRSGGMRDLGDLLPENRRKRTAEILSQIEADAPGGAGFPAWFRQHVGGGGWLEPVRGRPVTEVVRICWENGRDVRQHFPPPKRTGSDGAQTAQPSGDGAEPEVTAPPTP